MADKEESGEGLVATNRKARHDYTILDTYEAGLVLKGTEVKSLRQGKATLTDGYAMLKNGEVWLIGMHISPYEHGSYSNVDPIRSRKLLLHKTEIRKLAGKMQRKLVGRAFQDLFDATSVPEVQALLSELRTQPHTMP